MECTTRPHGRSNINQHVQGHLTTATSWGVYKLETTGCPSWPSDNPKDGLAGKSKVKLKDDGWEGWNYGYLSAMFGSCLEGIHSFRYILHKQPILGLTQEWFRELPFSRLECGVHNRLHIYPLCWIFHFHWHRHPIEGTNGLYCPIWKTQAMWDTNVRKFRSGTQITEPPRPTRDKQSEMLRARFLHLKSDMPCPGIEPRSLACQAAC